MDSLLEVRSQINSAASKDEHGKPIYKISINDFIIKASALALRDVQRLTLHGQKKKFMYITMLIFL